MSGGSSRRRTGSSWQNSFSRFFSRSPSKEQEEGAKAAALQQPPRSARSFETKENESTSVICQRKESNPPPELLKIPVCENKNLSTEDLSISITPEDLKKANSLPSLAHEEKTASNDRQIKEGFFQYLGSLFGIPSKSPWKETEQSCPRAGPNKTEKDAKSPANHQESRHTEHSKQEIFIISTPGCTQGASNKNEEEGLIQSTSSVSQEVQKQPDGPSKKTESELVAPAVTYATYRGSARIKQLLKKQADLEQMEETSSPVNGSPSKNKENRTVSQLDSETTAIKTRSSLKGNAKPEIKDDKKDTQASIFLAEMGLDKNSQNVLSNNELKELKDKITLFPEMETIKNCTEELVSVKHVSISNRPEVNKNLLVEPILLPKEATSSCQNIDPVKMYSVNSRLVERGREASGEIQKQLQSNNATVVDAQKGMHFCALSTTETKDSMQGEFSSYLKPDSTPNERQLLQDKCSCNSSSEDQFQLNSDDQTLYWNSTVCSGQAASSTVNRSENVVTEPTEQTSEHISSDACIPPHEQREELLLTLQGLECNTVSNTIVEVDPPTSAQSTETVQGVGTYHESDPISGGVRESEIHGGMHNTHNFTMISNIKNEKFGIENCSVPLAEFSHGEMTNILPNATEANNANTSSSVVEYKNVESRAVCASSLETEGARTDKAPSVNDAPLILEAKDGSYHHLAHRDEDKALIKTSASLDIPLVENTNVPLELGKTRLVSNRGCNTVTEPSPSSSKMTEAVVAKNPVTSAGTNDPLVHEMRNCSEVGMAPSVFEIKELSTIGLSPISPEAMSLPTGFSPAVKPENSSSSVFTPASVSVLASNSCIFEGKIISLDNMSKLVPNSEVQQEASCLPDKQENTNRAGSLGAINSAEVYYSNTHCSASVYETGQAIKNLEVCGPLSAAESVSVDKISNPFLESGDVLENKVISDTRAPADIRTETLPCSEETNDTAGLCPLDCGSNLIQENICVSTSDGVCSSQPTSSSTTYYKDTSELCFLAGETTDVALDKINYLSINSDNEGKMQSKQKSNGLPSELTSKRAYPAPFPPSVAHDAGAPVKKVLEMAEEEKEEHPTPSRQPNHHYLAAVISQNPVEIDNQAIIPLFTKPCSQFSEETLKDVETGKQVHIKYQDVTVLFKKADEIVDAVLLLAIEEIRSKQAAGVCQTNDFEDSLLGPSLQKDQKTQEILLESKEIWPRSPSLKHFNESDIGMLSGVQGKDTVGTDIQDEKIHFDINDKFDLHSSIALKAKEIVDDAINTAKQKLTGHQHEHCLDMGLSQNIAFRSQTDALERLPTATELTVKPPQTIEDPMHLSPEFPAVVLSLIGDHDVANSSSPLYINPKYDSSGIITGEMAPSNVVSSSKKGDEWSDSATKLESSPAERAKGESVCDGTHVTDASDKTSNWTDNSESEYSSNVVNGETVMIDEQLKSFSSVPGNVLPFNSSDNSYTKSRDVYGLLDLFGSNEETELPKCSCKENKATAFASEELHEEYCEIDSERGHSKMKRACTVLQDKNRFISQCHISESSVMSSSAKLGMNSDFTCEEAAITEPGLTMASVVKDDDDDDRRKSFQYYAFSPEKEWEGNSSFTILYEGTLQNESFPCSMEESEHPLSSLPDLSLDNIEHLLMCETAKGKLQSVQPFEESSQFYPKLDDARSESFVAVEAKRYKVYPFSLSPIYEDDSSQEDMLSTDISPGCPSEKSRECSNQSLSVLSLLQSVSERLKSSEHCSEEELHDEDRLEDEKEVHISNNLSMSNTENIHERPLLSRHSTFLSKGAFGAEETLSLSRLHLQKPNPSTKPFSRSLYYECLLSSKSCSGEKGTKFGSILLPKDQQAEDEGEQKLEALGMCPVDRERLKCNPRPGKVVIYDVHGKNKCEIYHDVPDATEWIFSNKVLIKVVRGCWILYEEPEFQGQKYVLEEGEDVTNDIWNPNNETHQGHFTIGSVRQIMKNCSVPEVELYSHVCTDHFPIRIQCAVANLEELEAMNPTLSVKAGIWFAYSDANYKGEVMVLEENHSPCEISAADVKSLHPLKMGGLKVQMPMNTKIIIYERAQFGGRCKELSENIDCVPTLFRNADDFQGIGSIRVIGGIWAAYEKERYKGKQYLLEEGEYEDWQSWGGMNSVLLSFRFLQADFMKSEITLFEMDEENGKVMDIVNQEIPDLEQAGFGPVTRSVNVKSGVWVAYQQKYFCGEQYVLEKGKYKCFFDWGGSSETVMSVRPVKLEPLGNHEPTHWLKAFSNTHFQGLCMDFTTEITDFASFTPHSFKVLRGCWLLRYQGETADNQCVLEEDLYSDLSSCGCPVAAIKSLTPVDYLFAEPLISLFTLENCEGRELNVQEDFSSVLNKDLHFLTQSVWVRSGLWIAYEGSNFLGKQFLLDPCKISNWTQFSGWKTIGSLRPVKQPAAYFRIKNRSQDKYLTVAGNLMDARATSVCLSPLNGKDTQIWCYNCGLIKSKVNDACLDVIGGKDVPGAKVALWVEHGKTRQKWTFNKDGTISSYLSDQLVLDIKGGYYYDRNHIIINQINTSDCTQRWDFEIL